MLLPALAHLIELLARAGLAFFLSSLLARSLARLELLRFVSLCELLLVRSCQLPAYPCRCSLARPLAYGPDRCVMLLNAIELCVCALLLLARHCEARPSLARTRTRTRTKIGTSADVRETCTRSSHARRSVVGWWGLSLVGSLWFSFGFGCCCYC